MTATPNKARQRVVASGSQGEGSRRQAALMPMPDATRYKTLTPSVRWATLRCLAEADREISTGGIAAALQAGGYNTNAAVFGDVVSGKLGLMVKWGEAERTRHGHYRVTPLGRDKWAMVQRSPIFRRATSSYRTRGVDGGQVESPEAAEPSNLSVSNNARALAGDGGQRCPE